MDPGMEPGMEPGMDPAGAFPVLERELRAALAEDERRQREGEAKLRALRQGVPDYGQFREIVLASHLKPLEKKDRLGQRRSVLWNPCAAPAETAPLCTVEIPQELDQLPGTAAEFHRDWRRCMKSGTEKYQFLLELGGEALGRIFQADVGFGLLGEFLTVLAENIHPGDRAAILQILQSLAATKRFGLNVALLSQAEKESSQDLFRKLQSRDWQAAGQPGCLASCEAGRKTHPMETHLEKESEEERTVVELMKCYQVS
ncbi:coiled-coil domain-containing protein 103 [Onychostruthus taczanowskii]|uniref:coiled-coil domain-containing protein 103 n=1 Tax=Onychostruthus taczanowskii TaxID=356909 RepID=UPI001B804B57|nr:coiled-coil domain-containing protein 103 [Onychostruthus taczanowskii]